MSFHSNYWSCSAFADFIRGSPKGVAKTSKEWREWRASAKAERPVRYWIAEEGLSWAQDVVTWPVRKLYDVKYWINNRFITKTHALTSNLKRGQWHEFETRLLHSMFDSLVDFVEIEEAWSNIAWDKEAREKYQSPWYAIGWFRWRVWRCPAAGIDRLEWASKLTNEEWLPDDQKHLAELTQQAINAKELIALYNWWKNVRPARPDPHDASGWTAICKKSRQDSLELFDLEDQSEEEVNSSRAAIDLCTKIEESYHKEDEEMMVRLIRIRRGMWT